MEQSPNVEPETRHRRPNYLLVFLGLTALTGLEVLVAYSVGTLRVWFLLGMALLKALLVIFFYMHLFYESRWYALIFFLPFALVIPLLMVINQ
jgi:cytochrome c oxidase subunit IV